MKRPHCERRSLFAILLWILALTLVLVGAGLLGADEARADPPVVAAFRVVDFLPVAGETKAPLAPVVMAIFNLPVNTSTVTADSFFMEKPGGAKVKAHFEFDTGNTRVFLRTDEVLQPATTYRVVLTGAIRSQAWLPALSYPLLPTTWTFRTTAPPKVVETIPAAEAKNVPLDQTVRVIFDQEIDPTSVRHATFYLTWVGGFFAIESEVYCNANHREIMLVPTDGLREDTTYQAILTTGLKGKNGAPLEKQVTWYFSTAAKPLPPPPPPAGVFTDVDSKNPYYEAITELASRGIVSGYGDGRFGPKDPVRRAQFAKMIVGVLGLPVTENDFPHPDVTFIDLGTDNPNDLYPHEYVSVCFRNGITLGKDATHFAPYDFITRYQVISMVVRAAKRFPMNMVVGEPQAGYGAWRGDATHGYNAAWAELNGLLTGLDLTLDPYGDMTRGEVARVLYTLLLLRAPVVT